MSLKEMQKAFAHAITIPLGQELECPSFISKGPILSPKERLEIYQRLYWYRLFNAFHACYPFLTRLFGYDELHEKIAEPYLLKYPSKGWAINRAFDFVPKWIEENYVAKDKQLVLHAANIDLAYELSYFAPSMPPIKKATDKICLQPHIHLFKMPADFFAFRELFLKESVEYWTENPFPKIAYNRTCYFILYRMEDGIVYEEICDKQYAILSNLRDWEVEDPRIAEWFCNWTCKGFICDSEEERKC